jgi:hypothetical protein
MKNMFRISHILTFAGAALLAVPSMAQVDKEGRSRDAQQARPAQDQTPPKTDRPTERVEAQLQGRSERMQAAEVERLVSEWPKEQQKVVMEMREKYGEPVEATSSMVKWRDSGEFKYTKVMKEPVDHDFPMPHKDFLEQGINYKVPPEKAGELAAFDGSVYFDRTKGTMSARCDKEENNILALNLAHDVITGKRSVKDAREFFARTASAAMKGKKSEYMEKLLFKVPDNTADKDKPMKMAEQ